VKFAGLSLILRPASVCTIRAWSDQCDLHGRIGQHRRSYVRSL